MNDKSKPTTSVKAPRQYRGTDVTNLSIEVNSGEYYLLAKVAGKGYKERLDTTSKTEAKDRLNRRLAAIRDAAAKGVELKSELTVGECAKIWLADQVSQAEAGELSAEYVETSLGSSVKKIWKIFPKDFAATAIRKVTLDDLKTGHSKIYGTGSATLVNTVRRCLHGFFETAIDRKVLTENLADKLPNKTKRDTLKEIPTDEQITKLLAHISRKGYSNSHKFKIVEFIQFLCWTGCRQNEAANTEVRDVDFAKLLLKVRICKGSGGDESRARFVPIAPQAVEFFTKLVQGKQPGDALLGVSECLETLELACKELNLPKYVHHTFRHVFATRALEATGCDYFTVAHWLGHTDGGKLLARKYAHLNQAHSQKQAAKLSFTFGSSVTPPVIARTIVLNGKQFTHEEILAALAAQGNLSKAA